MQKRMFSYFQSDISSGAFWLCFRELDSLCAFPHTRAEAPLKVAEKGGEGGEGSLYISSVNIQLYGYVHVHSMFMQRRLSYMHVQ